MTFTDEEQTSLNCLSTWQKSKKLKNHTTQTSALLTNDTSVQSFEFTSVSIQTDASDEIRDESFDMNDLSRFLKSVENIMSKNLTENINSKAFVGLEGVLAMQTSTAINTLTLNNIVLDGSMSVQGLSWNSSGSVIGVAYGTCDHENWCTHKGMFCTWNIDRGRINVNKPDQSLDVSSCLMCIEFHPTLPSMCAGGAFDGQVVIWDLAKTEDLEVCLSKHIEDGHHEPVTQLTWKSNKKQNHLVSVAMDGKILIWDIKLSRYASPEMILLQGFIISGRYIPRNHPSAPSNRQAEVGVTCVSFSKEDSNVFVAGCESGLVVKCSTLSNEPPMGKGTSIQFRSPITLTYNSHKGPVYDASFSQYHRNVFLTSSTDCTLKLYNALQPKPYQTFEPVAGYVFCVEWSPIRPLVFAATTSTGTLLIYDLHKSRISPVLTIPVNQTQSPVYAATFNKKSSDLLCTGDSRGIVKVWKLSQSLANPVPGEKRLLDRIAASSYE